MTYFRKRIFMLKCSAFTLMEIMIAIGIIMVMAAVALPMFGKMGAKGRVAAATSQIRSFELSITSFQIDTGKLPKDLDELIQNNGDKKWDGPYIKKKEIPKDPWGNEYVYEITSGGAGYTITSQGSDNSTGGEGEAADITNE